MRGQPARSQPAADAYAFVCRDKDGLEASVVRVAQRPVDRLTNLPDLRFVDREGDRANCCRVALEDAGIDDGEQLRSRSTREQ